MATTLAVNNIVRATMYTTQGDQYSAVSWFYKVTAIGGSPATDLDFATNVDTLVATLYKARLATTSAYDGIQAQVVWPQPIPVSVAYTASAGAGTNGGTCQDRQSAGITSWQTAFAKQKNRGRTYWPFPSASDNTTNGIPSNTWVTALGTLCTALLGYSAVSNGGRTATVEMGIYHRALHTTTPLVSYVVRQKWGTQRRRSSYGRTGVSPI